MNTVIYLTFIKFYTSLFKMKVTIILILGFCYSECYANPNRCTCVPNTGVSNPIETRLRLYGHEQVQERFGDPEILAPEKRKTSSNRITTGSGNGVGPGFRKNQLNFQKSKQSEYELGENSETGNWLKQEKILGNLLELIEHSKKRNSKNNTYVATTGYLGFLPARPLGIKRENSGLNLYPGIYNPPYFRNGRTFFRPDIKLQQEDVREPDLCPDAASGDYEYEL